MALKYTYEPCIYYHRGLSVRTISYSSALPAKLYLFISPKEHLIHIENAFVVTSVIPYQKDRKNIPVNEVHRENSLLLHRNIVSHFLIMNMMEVK